MIEKNKEKYIIDWNFLNMLFLFIIFLRRKNVHYLRGTRFFFTLFTKTIYLSKMKENMLLKFFKICYFFYCTLKKMCIILIRWHTQCLNNSFIKFTKHTSILSALDSSSCHLSIEITFAYYTRCTFKKYFDQDNIVSNQDNVVRL